jgi:hypothetical protein
MRQARRIGVKIDFKGLFRCFKNQIAGQMAAQWAPL